MATNQKQSKPFARETGAKGMSLVIAQLNKRGAYVQMEEGPANLLSVTSADGARMVTVRTKTKGPTSNIWQISTTVAKKPEEPVDENEFWVLVDLPKRGEPRFYIIPGKLFRRDIYHDFQKYLEKHGGERPVTPGSTHHGISLNRVCDFENRWDLMKL